MEPQDNILPDDDKDLMLARRLGGRDSDAPPATESEDSDRAFLDALVRLRAQHPAIPIPPAVKRSSWAAVSGAVRPTNLRLFRVASLRPVMAAAAVVAIIVVAWFFAVQKRGPQRVAQATTTRVEYRADDGSVVTLRPRSELLHISRSQTTDRYLLAGEAKFDVVHDPARQFEVETEDGVIAVLGTRFTVSTWGGETNVFLEQGSVRVTNLLTGDAALLEPGQKSTVQGRTLSQPSTAAADEFLDWLDGHVRFRSRAVRSVVAEIGHHFGVTVDIPEELESETITGSLVLDSLEETLLDLGTVLGGRFVQNGPDAFQFETTP